MKENQPTYERFAIIKEIADILNQLPQEDQIRIIKTICILLDINPTT